MRRERAANDVNPYEAGTALPFPGARRETITTMNGDTPGSPTGITNTTTKHVYVEGTESDTDDGSEWYSDEPYWTKGPSSGSIVRTRACPTVNPTSRCAHTVRRDRPCPTVNPTSRCAPTVQRTRCTQPLPKFSVSTHYTGNGRRVQQKEQGQEEEEEEIELAELPRESWLPACSCVSHKISMPNTKQSPFDFHSDNPRLLPSKTNGLRLLQA